MVEKKSKTGLIVGIVIIVVVAAVAGIVAINLNNSEEEQFYGLYDSMLERARKQKADSQNTDNLTMDDLINTDDVVFVDIDEYDTAQEVSKAIQNGEMTGKVIQFDGYVSHPGTKYSVVQKSEDGSKKIGTEFVIVDADESEYPEDGARVFITGKVVEKEPLYFVIETLKEAVNKL